MVTDKIKDLSKKAAAIGTAGLFLGGAVSGLADDVVDDVQDKLTGDDDPGVLGDAVEPDAQSEPVSADALSDDDMFDELRTEVDDDTLRKEFQGC